MANATPLFDVPNLDGLSIDPADYFKASEIFHTLSIYCQTKVLAMKYRTTGNIEQATFHELKLEKLYAKLPTGYKW